MKGPNGSGAFAGDVAQPPPLSFWNAGGYWYNLPSSLVSTAAGARVLVPVGSPITANPAMGGNPAIQLTGTQYYTCNALSTLFDVTKSFTVAVRFRTTSLGFQSIWGAGYEFAAQSLRNEVSGNFPQLISNNTIAPLVTRLSSYNVQYDDHVMITSYNQATGITKIYIDGQLTSVTNANSPLPTYAVAVLTTFCLGCWLVNAPNQPFSGFVKRFAVSGSAITDSQARGLSAAWGPATDYTLPLARSPKILQAGDSLTRGQNDATGLGYRGNMMNVFTIPNRLSLCNVGQFNDGPFPNDATSAIGGATCDVIKANALTIINGADVVDFLMVMGGTNDIVPLGVSAALISYSSMLSALESAGRARNPAFKICVMTIPPIKPGESGASLVDPFNAGLVPIWDAYDAAHPTTPLLRAGVNAALSPWSLTNYSNDAIGYVHPNATGYATMWSAGIQPAVSSYLLALGAGHQ